jgi:hypothetical protein
MGLRGQNLFQTAKIEWFILHSVYVQV